jgi:hypothetical protein
MKAFVPCEVSDRLNNYRATIVDILDLTNRFKIKNKKVEIDEVIGKLKEKHGVGRSEGRRASLLEVCARVVLHGQHRESAAGALGCRRRSARDQ